MDKKEILGLAFDAMNNGEICQIKMPQASEIHKFNMALNSLVEHGYITVQKRNMTQVVIELTESGLDACI